jgi:hypothetical protein
VTDDPGEIPTRVLDADSYRLRAPARLAALVPRSGDDHRGDG